MITRNVSLVYTLKLMKSPQSQMWCKDHKRPLIACPGVVQGWTELIKGGMCPEDALQHIATRMVYIISENN